MSVEKLLLTTSFTFISIGSLTQAIRNFAKSLEGWLKNAMQNVPEEMFRTKVSFKMI